MDEFKGALEAAHREASSFYTKADTARIVAAFLRALPPQMVEPTAEGGIVVITAHNLAAGVERAAKDDAP